MRKFAVGLILLVFGLCLCSTSLWAGDSEIRKGPNDKVTMPLMEEEPASQNAMTEPESAPAEVKPEAAMTEPAKPKAVMAEPAPEKTVTKAKETAEKPAPEVVASVEPAAVKPPPPPKDDLTVAAELYDEKGLENYKKGLELCEKTVKKEPNSFKANWMAARGCRLYGMEAQEQQLSNWKDICKLYGKKGMAYADKAISLNPKAVNGYFWYGMNVGIYADSVSILTALKEGLKDKTQNSFETAYKIDKNYEDGGAIAALGRFWAVLPWPLNDDEKSMKYYREYQNTPYFGMPDHVEVNVYFGELLIDSRKTRAEGVAMLKQVPRISNNKYWNAKAKALLDDM